MPETDSSAVLIRKEDISITAYKAPGKGGQKRNKTFSACRVIHLSSGIIATCADERSFNDNKARALEDLRRRLQKSKDDKAHEKSNQIRNTQVQSDRAAKSFTHNYQRGTVTCHETGQSWSVTQWKKGNI